MSGKQWSSHLGYSVNFINTMRRNKGKDFTISFIEENDTVEKINERHEFKSKCVPKGLYPYDRISNRDIRNRFESMVNRCYSKHHKAYRHYGGKGVGICDEWMQNPERFEEWALANGFDKDLTIDRIDSSKGYSPDNCRFITLVENSKWTATTRSITVNGITDSGRGWDNRLGLSPCKINNTIRNKGMDAAIALIEKELGKAA